MTRTVGFTQANAYRLLQTHAQEIRNLHLRQMFQDNPQRASQLSVTTPYGCYDYARQRVTPETMRFLEQLADEIALPAKIQRMFAGEPINRTEDRAALHVALRDLSNTRSDVKIVLDQIEAFSKQVLNGQHTGVTGKKIKNVVAIGIGGSYLGPEYLATALRPYAQEEMNLVFVTNVDGTDFIEKTAGLDPAETMIVVSSKSFTTAETMQNARTAKAWILEGLDHHAQAIAKHFVAVTTNHEEVVRFGIDPANMFGFWNWVGGRFSATSAVGAVPLSLYLGFDNFKQVLQGAHWMDQHFLTSPILKNIPILSALLDIWNINFMGWQTRALLPYSQGLSRLPAHTQQVEMESNGKSVDLNGQPVDFHTGEVVFGEPGTNGQHSFYQSIHQGTQIIPCDFIGFVHPQYDLAVAPDNAVSHHDELMSNFLAQPDALAFGRDAEDPHRHFPGNRPSSSLLLNRLDPFTAGLLLAWTEHRAAVKGFIWGINSFDQFGVELGKGLGRDYRKRIAGFRATGSLNLKGLNPSTAALLQAFLREE